jgi:2'-hydroxyisoflavone reductase
MRVLVVGGTAFVGRHITEAAIAAGHEVTLFHRGKTGREEFPQATHLTGDRDQDLSALAGGEWDATIDVCCYLPRQAHALAAALRQRGGHHVFISSTSVYRTPVAAGFAEDAPLEDVPDPATEQIDEQTYGGLKVACERAVAERHAAGFTIVRPTYVIGPYDRSYRFTWWVERIARGGMVLAPHSAHDPIQVIDARDMGAWIVSLIGARHGGIYHAVSPAPPFRFRELLESIVAEVGPAGTELVWVDEEFLLANGQNDLSLPLWPGGDNARDINAADPAAAYATGLAPRPLRQSIAEIHAAERVSATPARPGVGLPAQREADLLASWRSRH